MTPFIHYLRNQGISVVELPHCYSVASIVDIMKEICNLYDRVERKWILCEDVQERQSRVLELLAKYPKRDPFKKTAKGGMTYQEFRHTIKNR